MNHEPSLSDVLAAVQTGFAEIDSKINDLTTSTDALARKIDSYLNKEWAVHLHSEHPHLETRISTIERKLGIG